MYGAFPHLIVPNRVPHGFTQNPGTDLDRAPQTAEAKEAAAKAARAQADAPAPPPLRREVVHWVHTLGATAAHTHKFKEGGILSIEVAARKQSASDAQARGATRPQGNAPIPL